MYRGVWGRNVNEREHLEDRSVDEQIILKCISKQLYRIAWPKSGYCEHCNDTSGIAITWSVGLLTVRSVLFGKTFQNFSRCSPVCRCSYWQTISTAVVMYIEFHHMIIKNNISNSYKYYFRRTLTNMQKQRLRKTKQWLRSVRGQPGTKPVHLCT